MIVDEVTEERTEGETGRVVTRSGVRSPLVWLGGKYYSAVRILSAFPPADCYDVYVEPMGGAAHVLAQKPPGGHIEVYNDIDENLVNFWQWMRDEPALLCERLQSLPYSRALYYRYHASLYGGTELDSLERAVRWFYVLRSSFSARVRSSPHGWKCGMTRNDARIYQQSLRLFSAVAERFRFVHLENRDAVHLIRRYGGPRTLFYVDPPYINCESYYQGSGFTPADHERLAEALNATESLVALSYYEHPLLEKWYPATRWRRLCWSVPKHAQRRRRRRDRGQEVLLMNYPADLGRRVVAVGLWEEEGYGLDSVLSS